MERQTIMRLDILLDKSKFKSQNLLNNPWDHTSPHLRKHRVPQEPLPADATSTSQPVVRGWTKMLIAYSEQETGDGVIKVNLK